MLAIIDGDMLAYKACFKRPAPINQPLRDLDDEGEMEIYPYTPGEDAAYIELCWNNCQRHLLDLPAEVFATETIVAVKGDYNYRDDLYPLYKANRKDIPKARQNIAVPVIRQRLIDSGIAYPAHGREADDMLRIWSEQATMHGIAHVIISGDKDLLCIPGKHFIMHKKTLVVVTPIEAHRHYYTQLLKGDPTDNIPGVPKIGDVRAKMLLENCNNEEEMQEVVIDAYIRAYHDDWLPMLLSNGKMIHIQKHENDYFHLQDWPIARELRNGL
jgi:5'-3' exonuclease